jgi:hypothetical protein
MIPITGTIIYDKARCGRRHIDRENELDQGSKVFGSKHVHPRKTLTVTVRDRQ